MAVYADRVKETTTTTGIGTYNLAGAATGFRTFVAGVGSGSVVTYAVENGTDWEIGEGTVTDATPDTLSRTIILASSNAGAAVSWAAGTKNVFLTAAAARTVFTDKSNTFTQAQTFPAGSVSTPSITFTGDTDTGIYNTTDRVLVTTGGKIAAEFYHAAPAGNTDNSYMVFENDGGPTSIPTLRAQSDSADKGVGVYAKGSSPVYFGNSNTTSMLVNGSTHYLNINSYSSYTDIEAVSGADVELSICSAGASIFSGVSYYALGGGSYRALFSTKPGVAITGPQNYVTAYSSNAGGQPSLEAEGGDANINLDLTAKGTGALRLNGTATTVSSTGFVSTTKGFAAAEFSAGSGAPGTITWSNGQNQTKTLTSSGTMTFASPLAGSTYKLRIVQGGAGSFTITWPTIKWAGGVAPTLSTAAGAEDIISLYYNGTSYYGQAGTGFA